MNSRWHPLIPFDPDGPAGVAIAAQARVLRPTQQLELHFRVRGAGTLLLPERLERPSQPERRDGLWEHTCLEAFVSAETEGYWEFNLAPSGHWNVYRLEGYRQGLVPERFYDALPMAISRGNAPGEGEGDTLELSLRCPLPPPLAAAAELQVGLTAVLESRSGPLTYWALHHPGPAADFHLRDGWSLRL